MAGQSNPQAHKTQANPRSEAKVAIITGASSGIGEATGRLLSSHGYRVVLAARRLDRLEALADEVKDSGGEALAVQTDIRDPADIHALTATTLKEMGQIDILFNNAGFGRMGWLEDLDPAKDIEEQLQVNLLGLILLSRSVLPHMIEQRSGHIINMASMASFVATPTYTIYAASKFGVRGFSEALRRETAVWGIHVSTVFSGAVRSEFKDHMGYTRKTGLSTPGRLTLGVEDVAETVYRLIQKPRRDVVIPWTLRLASWSNVLLPGVLDRLMTRKFVKPERGL